MGLAEHTLELADRALAMDPQDPHNYALRANVLVELKEYQSVSSTLISSPLLI